MDGTSPVTRIYHEIWSNSDSDNNKPYTYAVSSFVHRQLRFAKCSHRASFNYTQYGPIMNGSVRACGKFIYLFILYAILYLMHTLFGSSRLQMPRFSFLGGHLSIPRTNCSWQRPPPFFLHHVWPPLITVGFFWPKFVLIKWLTDFPTEMRNSQLKTPQIWKNSW